MYTYIHTYIHTYTPTNIVDRVCAGVGKALPLGEPFRGLVHNIRLGCPLRSRVRRFKKPTMVAGSQKQSMMAHVGPCMIG